MRTNTPALVWDSGKYNFQRKLGNFVQYFQVNIPVNKFGIPTKIVNPLPIAENMYGCETTDDIPDEAVEEALREVEYDDGVPLVDGLPIWERFEGEPVEYYKLFKEYREMKYITGSRALSKLAATHLIAGKYLSALSKVYHWQLRCRAYDLFREMEFERQRMYDARKLETKHKKAADKLLEQAMAFFENHPEQMDSKTALQMVQLAMKAGRLALGLHPEKPASESEARQTNIHINNITQTGDEGEGRKEIGEAGQHTSKKDMSYLQSIVQILESSGALDEAKKDMVIDADYVEVKGDGEDENPDAL